MENEIDPSIKLENLVVQDGEDKGRINAFETEQGTAVEMIKNDANKFEPVPVPNLSDSEQPYTVEGLPVIGAEAENAHRDEGYIPSKSDVEEFKKRSKDSSESILYGKVPEETNPEQMAEILHDLAGTEAMAEEAKRKAIEFAKKQFPFASPEKIEEFGQKAVDKFKAELESENAEKKAQHDQGVQELIDSLNSPDKKLSEVVPDVPETPTEISEYIDSSKPETPTPVSEDGEWVNQP